MPVPLLTTKLYLPPLRPDAVCRPRLTSKLLAGLKIPGSFALVSGPAGFGKTTLLSEFSTALNQPTAWLSLDEGDEDANRFWSYVITAFQSVLPGLGEQALALLRAPVSLPAETIPAILINDIARLNQDLVLFLDDFHTIQNEAIHSAVTFLLEHIPANLHVVVSTRVDPPWPLARFRARNKLVEVRAQDLRFTSEETAAFLNQMMGLNLTPQDVAALEERTEGWVAGLQLAALSMKGRGDSAAFVKALTGSHVYIAEYLLEEVLLQQPPDVQAFLLQTSLLDRLTAGLCEAVVACEDGQRVLAALQHGNLFLLSLDDEGRWFRYHHLFADLLQARLRQTLAPEAIEALHRRAAAWYEQAGFASEAIEHALAARDYEHAVRLIAKNALPMILQAYVRTLESWLKAVPASAVETNPRANMALAWLNILRGTAASAEPYLQRLEAFFSSPEDYSQDGSLQGEWLALQSEVLNRQGNPTRSQELASQALEILPFEDAAARSMAHVNLATAYERMLDYEQAAGAYQAIVQDARTAGDSVLETLGISGWARMLLIRGRLKSAFAIASDGIQRLESSGRVTPFCATLYGELGQIYYHWHKLDLARQYLRQSVQLSGQSGYSDPEIYEHVMLSRMFQMEGDWPGSAREMGEVEDLVRRIPPAMISEEVTSQQVRVELACGRLAAAQDALGAAGFSFAGGFEFPALADGAPVPHQAGLLYNSALRVLLELARSKKDQNELAPGTPMAQARSDGILTILAPGIRLAALVLEGELKCQHIPAAVETLLLRSQMQAEAGDLPASLADVSQALELAQPEAFISIFVQEGQPIAAALVSILETGLPGSVQASYVNQILAAFPASMLPRLDPAKAPPAPGQAAALIEQLTPRELEVLQLIAAGDSNSDIASKLFITVSAVKKHSANIYAKLNVNSRTQALARARQLRLLPLDK